MASVQKQTVTVDGAGDSMFEAKTFLGRLHRVTRSIHFADCNPILPDLSRNFAWRGLAPFSALSYISS